MGVPAACMVVEPVRVIMVSSMVASLVNLANSTDVARLDTLVVADHVVASHTWMVAVHKLMVASLDTLDRLTVHLVVAQDLVA